MTRLSTARWLLALGAALVAAAGGCAGGIRPTPLPVPGRELPSHLRIRPADGGPVQRVALEEYVRATILSEVVPAREDAPVADRMFAVQAVIARTYAVANRTRHAREGFDLCSTTHCQLFQPARLRTSSWAAAAARAARATEGRVLWYRDAPANTLFHSDCGGRTSGDGDVWGGPPHPYLEGAADGGPAREAHGAWRFEIGEAALTRALNASARTRVGTRLLEIVALERDRAGRATVVLLRGTREPVVRGEELRQVLTRAFGARSVRSTLFEVARRGDAFVFSGRGFGHGVGLCQTGALARVRAGARPEQVFAHYFPGTGLVRLR